MVICVFELSVDVVQLGVQSVTSRADTVDACPVYPDAVTPLTVK